MKKISIKGFSLFIALVIILTIIISVDVFSTKDQRKAIALIDGEKMYEDIDSQLMLKQSQGIDTSSENIVRKSIQDALIKKEVKELHLGISDKLFEKYFEEYRKSIDTDDMTREIFNKTLAVYNMTEDEYLKMIKPIYHDMCNRGLYKNRMKDEFSVLHKGLDSADFQKQFDDYFNAHIDDLYLKYNVELVE
jgi:hypothetical protein